MPNRIGIAALAMLHTAWIAAGCNIDDRIVSAPLQDELGDGDAGAVEPDVRDPGEPEPGGVESAGPVPALVGNGGRSGESSAPMTGGIGDAAGGGGMSGMSTEEPGAGGVSGLGGTGQGAGGSELEPSPPTDDPPPPSIFSGRAGAEFCPAGPYPSPLPGVPQVQQLFAFGESRIIDGPVWLDGALYFSAVGAVRGPSRIDRFVLGGALETAFISDTGTNGLALDMQGNLLGAHHVPDGISRFALPSGASSPVAPGGSFISPNDLVQRSDGNIYLTDLSRNYLDGTGPFSSTQALRITPAGQVIRWDPNLLEANGITLSPDGNHLYLTTRTRFVRYPLASDGTPLSGVELVPSEPLQSPEGMAMDCAGNVYTTEATRRLVRIFDPFGNELGRFGGPQVFAGELMNLAFGGPNRSTLFITTFAGATTGGVYTAELNVPGLPY